MAFKPLLLCLVFPIALFCGTSCGNVTMQEELAKIDTLQNKIQQAKETLVLDENLFKERRDTIEQRMRYIQRNYADAVDWQMQQLMTDYRGLHRAYRSFVKEYPNLKKENKLHAERIENLKKDVLEGNVQKKEFEEYYVKERKIVFEHYSKVKETVNRVLSIEPEYKRINPKVEDIYTQLREQKPTGDVKN